MKQLLAGIILLLFSFKQTGNYGRDTLSYMSANAARILYGEIIKVDSTCIIVQPVQGYGESCFYKVHKLKGRSLKERWMPYQKGQKLVLFIAKRGPGSYGGPLDIMSLWGEGEMPVYKGKLYLQYNLKNVSQNSYLIYGKPYSGYEYDIDAFMKAVKCFRKQTLKNAESYEETLDPQSAIVFKYLLNEEQNEKAQR